MPGLAAPRAMRLALICASAFGAAAAWPAGALAQAPVIASVTPDSGPAAGATTVRIEGTGFEPGDRVDFGGVAASQVEVASERSLTAQSPPGSGTIDVTVAGPGGASEPVSHDWFAYEPAPDALWLGLDDNSENEPEGHLLGPVDEFSSHGIVYDRDFNLTAGQLPSETESDGRGGTRFEDHLALDHEYGMIPVATIEFSGDQGNLTPTPWFPREQRTSQELAEGRTTVAEYAAGFVRSASAIICLISSRYPGMPILLEPINEPWGYTTPWYNGAEYAKVLAPLLPAAQAAGIPLSDIYVSAFGADRRLNAKGEKEEYAPGWVPAIYEAEPALRSEIRGWYFHPYGPPAGTEMNDSWGIQSVAEVRRLMSSGEDNIIVSEVGYCARQAGGDCQETGEAEVEGEQEAASRLTEMLGNALPYHEAGWLKALIVYARSDGGWSMQAYPGGQLEALGEAYEQFAAEHARVSAPGGCALSASLPAGPLSQGLGVGAGQVLAQTCEQAPGPPAGGAGPEVQESSSPETASGSGAPLSAPDATAHVAALPAGASLSSSRILVSGALARVRMACAASGRCRGRVRLVLRGAHGRLFTLCSGSFSLAGDSRGILTLRAAASRRALLDRAGRAHTGADLEILQSSPGPPRSQGDPVGLALAPTR
jgi:hypothetical protein